MCGTEIQCLVTKIKRVLLCWKQGENSKNGYGGGGGIKVGDNGGNSRGVESAGTNNREDKSDQVLGSGDDEITYYDTNLVEENLLGIHMHTQGPTDKVSIRRLIPFELWEST